MRRRPPPRHSEWGLAGRNLCFMPNNDSSGETYASGWLSGNGTRLTITVGGDRLGTCGF